MSVYRFKATNSKGTTVYSALLEEMTRKQAKARMDYMRRTFPAYEHTAEVVGS